MSTMSSRHAGASFNHSCLKVPVNPDNQLPSTSFERKHALYVESPSPTNRVRVRKSTHFQGVYASPSSSRPHSASYNKNIPQDKKMSQNSIPLDIEPPAKDSLKSFLSFYESIPDYRDINHLSDREFNIKLQHLKEQQRQYVDVANLPTNSEIAASGDALPVTNITNPSPKPDIIQRCSTEISKTLYKPPSAKESLHGKKCFLGNKDSAKPYMSKTQIHQRQFAWDKLDGHESEGTPSTISLACEPRNKSNFRSPSPQIKKAYEYDSEETIDMPEPKLCSNINDLIFKEKHGILSSPHELYKTSKKKKEGTNKARYIHSASTSKSKNMDSSSSIVDWDEEDALPKREYFFSDSDSLPDMRYSHSAPSSPTMKPFKTVAWKEPKITIPAPFKMTVRDEEEAHFEAMKNEIYADLLEEDARRDQKHFRANPVPLHTRLPLYDKIMSEQEERRRAVRKQCVSELRNQMAPFSFVKRDEERRRFRCCRSTPELREMSQTSTKPFRAKPVPRNLFGSAVYQRMREDEFYRSLKRKIRAEELLKASSLPPSMAAREQIAQAVTRAPHHESEPRRRSHRVPDYRKAHDAMRRELEERFSDNVSTSPQPFQLRTGQLRPRKNKRSSSIGESTSSSPYECYSSLLSHKSRPRSALCVTSGNRNNLASVLRMQSARQRLEREAQTMLEEAQRREAARLRRDRERRRPVWRELRCAVDDDLALRLASRREEDRMRRQRHEEDMERMLGRVERIPTLFQRQSQPKMSKSSKRQHKLTSRSNMPYNKRCLAFSSPDLFGGGSNRSDLSDEKSSRPDSKLSSRLAVSITEVADNSTRPGSNESEQDSKRTKPREDEKEDEQCEVQEVDEDDYSSVQENISVGKSSEEENEDQHSEEDA